MLVGHTFTSNASLCYSNFEDANMVEQLHSKYLQLHDSYDASFDS